MSEEKDTWLKMKPYLIFVAVLANFSCHGVSGAVFDRPSEEDNPMADGALFLPGLPGGQSLGQSGSYSAPSTTPTQPQTPNYPSYQPPQTNYQQNYPTSVPSYPSVPTYPSPSPPSVPTYPGPSTPPAVVPTPVPNVPGTHFQSCFVKIGN